MKISQLYDWIGLSRNKVSYKDCMVSGLGGFISILTIYLTSSLLLSVDVAVIIVPSMAASAVLLFAAPQAPFSQPWNLVAGHAVSAFIGVACWMLIPSIPLAASLSVGLSISAMYILRCIHPPGGATALAAVIGSEQLHGLGFSYELQPVLFNVAVLLIVAIVFNGLLSWRKYPSSHKLTTTQSHEQPSISHEQFVYALSQIDTLVDIGEDDLLKIYDLATNDQKA